MNAHLPLSQWIANLKYAILPVLKVCDHRKTFFHSRKFAEVALMLDAFRKNLDTLPYQNRIATRDEADKFRLLFQELSQMRTFVESFDKQRYLQTILSQTSAAMLEQLTSFRETFNALASDLNLSRGDVIALNPTQFAMNHREDIDFIIREIQNILKQGTGLRELQKEYLRQRVFELTKMKAQNGSSGQLSRVLMQQEIDARLEKYKEWVCPGSEFQWDVQIGRGGYSDVFLGYRQSTGETVAVKVLHCNEITIYDLDMLDRELGILSGFQHPCILPFVGLVQSPNYCIVTRYMPNDSLFLRLHDERYQREPLSATQKTIIAMGIAHGMYYLHSNRLIHRDLKSLNILLDDMLYPRIGDFGLSRRRADTNDVMTKGVGTSQWMAPEVIASQKYDEKADVYSFAIVLWEMETHQIPWQDCWDITMAMSVATQGKRLPIPKTCPKSLGTLIQWCWDPDPEKRPSFRTIVAKFDAGETFFAGTDMKEVEKYLAYLKDREPNDDALLEVCEQGDFQAYLDKYGLKSVINVVLDLIDKSVSDPDQIIPKCVQVIDQFVLAIPELIELFREKKGVKKLVSLITEPEFPVTASVISCLTKFVGDVTLTEDLLEVFSRCLVSDDIDLRESVVGFLRASCSQESEHLFSLVLPNLFATLKTDNDELLYQVLSLFETMLDFHTLSYEVNQHLVLFCDLLSRSAYQTKEKVLCIFKKDLKVYYPSGEFCRKFVCHLPHLLEIDTLRESTLYVLTEMTRSQQILPALGNLEKTALIDMLDTEPYLVVQSLKILFFCLLHGHCLNCDSIGKIETLLDSKDDRVANIAAMCLTVAQNYPQVIGSTLRTYCERAFESENELTLQALRLCGAVSQTSEGHAVVASFGKRICFFAASNNKEISNMSVMVLAALSFVDQESENLISVTKTVCERLVDRDVGDAALIFVVNMSVNYEAVLEIAPSLPVLVELLRKGEVRCIAPIHRIVTLAECYRYCSTCLSDLVRVCEQYLDTNLCSLVYDIFDAVATQKEANAIIRNSEIPELLQEKLQEIEKNDPSRVVLIRLVHRLK